MVVIDIKQFGNGFAKKHLHVLIKRVWLMIEASYCKSKL